LFAGANKRLFAERKATIATVVDAPILILFALGQCFARRIAMIMLEKMLVSLAFALVTASVSRLPW